MLRRALRSPAVHFLALGTVLYFVRQGILPTPDAAPEPIVIRAEERADLFLTWQRQVGRPPTAVELDAAIDDLVDQELLFREALALGLHHGDAVIARRLLANQRFIDPVDAAERTDEELLREAYDLGLERTDEIVRRRLVERMRQRILAAARRSDPQAPARAPGLRDDPANAGAAAPRILLHHVYLSRDRRGAALEDDARALLAELEQTGATPSDAAARALGDPLLLPRRLPLSTERELGARLGASFAADAFALPTGRWSGPIGSSYGLHLVWVEALEPVESGPRAADTEAPADHRNSPAATAGGARAETGAGGREWERGVLRAALTELRRGVVVIVEPERTNATAGDTH